MRGVNRVILVGHATRDTELHRTKSGKAVANLRIANNRVVDGAESAQYHTVVSWEGLAETTATYVTKGRLVYVEGRLEYRTFQDDEGKDRGVVEIVAADVQFLDRSSANGVPDAAEAEAVDPDGIPF